MEAVIDIPFLDQPLVVISAYVHTGDSGDENRMEEKLSFFAAMTRRMEILRSSGAYVLLTGDFNVGHTELDIKNWKGNRNNAGFLESERAWFDRWFDDLGWVDLARNLAGPVEGPTRGGVSEDKLLTGMSAGVSTTKLPHRSSLPSQQRLRSIGPQATQSGGAITLPRRHLQGLVRFVQDQRHQTTAQSRNAGDHAPSHHRLEHRRPWHAAASSTIGNTPPSLVEFKRDALVRERNGPLAQRLLHLEGARTKRNEDRRIQTPISTLQPT